MSSEAPDNLSAEDPINYLKSVAVELHEMFLSLVDVGFTKKEALYIVGQAVASGIMLPYQDISPEDTLNIQFLPLDDDEDNYPEDEELL
jgi:hypothetical protein